MVPLSLLDLSPIVEGRDAAHALRNTLDLARHAERWGYRRYWLAEHHNMPGIASAATAIVIGHVAGGTSTIRVGAGGIMLPNHSPLTIAEQFGTLALSGADRLRAQRAPAPTASSALRQLLAPTPPFLQDVVGDRRRSRHGGGTGRPGRLGAIAIFAREKATPRGSSAYQLIRKIRLRRTDDAGDRGSAKAIPRRRATRSACVMLRFGVFAAGTHLGRRSCCSLLGGVRQPHAARHAGPAPPPVAGFGSADAGPGAP
jgi:hypothetical protein